MLRPLFFNPPDTEAHLGTRNAGAPAADRDAQGERVRRIAGIAARLAGLSDPDGHAERVAAAFLPDVLTCRPAAAIPYAGSRPAGGVATAGAGLDGKLPPALSSTATRRM